MLVVTVVAVVVAVMLVVAPTFVVAVVVVAVAAMIVVCFTAARFEEIGFLGAAIDENDPDWAEEHLLANAMFEYVASLMAYELQEGRIYAETMPYMLGGLLSTVEDEIQMTLGKMRVLFDAITALDSAALASDALKNFRSNMVWPDQPYSREFLVAASECDFERLPTVMREELELHAQCPKTTCGVENSFRGLRDQERQHTASKLGKFARWHHAAHDTVLPDMDWPRLEPTLADRSNAASAPKAAATDFVAWKARELAPEVIFEQFMGERTWAVPSPDNFFKTAQATHTAIAFKEDFSWIERGFLCLLMEPRTFVMQMRAPKAKGIVLGSTDQGVNVWKARVAKATKEHFWIAMEPEDEKNMWSQVFVQDYSEWMELEVVAAPPCVKRPSEPEPKLGDCVGIYLVPKLGVEPQPLLRAAAKRAFHRMSMRQMRSLGDLLDGFEWPKPKPRSELDVCKVLMSHCLPTATDLELDAIIVDWRGAKILKPKWSSVFTNLSTGTVADLLERDEASDLQKSVLRLEDAMKQREKARAKLHPAKKAKAKPRKTIAGTAGGAPLARDEAKIFLSKLVGATISKDTTLHMRWKVSYPNDCAPFTFSKVWDAEVSDRSAMMRCLAWAWECHERATGEVCPWVLE